MFFTWIEIITKTKTGSSVLASAEYLQIVRVGRTAKEWLEYLSNPFIMGSVELPMLMFSTSYHYLYRCYSLCSH